MRIAFLPISSALASGRMRRVIPAAELAKRGHEITLEVSSDVDWLILAKHDWPTFPIRAKRIAYDVCDDHLDHPKHAAHYREWIGRADLITCNSQSMRERIKAATGRDAVVIDDPYESQEGDARCHAPALWFGHHLNLPAFQAIAPLLPDTVVISDSKAKGVTPWSPEVMRKAWYWCGITVLPTIESKPCKSANRAVESIRNGLYPVCGELPAYRELGLGETDIPGAVRDRLADPKGTIAEVKRLQAVIRDRFNPAMVGREWERALRASGNS